MYVINAPYFDSMDIQIVVQVSPQVCIVPVEPLVVLWALSFSTLCFVTLPWLLRLAFQVVRVNRNLVTFTSAIAT